MSKSSMAMLVRMAKSTGMVALGTALGQIFIFGSTPYLTRIYSPTQFGQLALLLSLSGIVMAAGTLRYELAIPGADDPDAMPLFALCVSLAVALSLFFLLLCQLPLHRWLHHPMFQLANSPGLIGAIVLGVALYQVVGALLVREGRFSALASLRTSQGMIFALLATTSWFGLMWSHVLSFLTGGVLLSLALLWRHRSEFHGYGRSTLRDISNKYKKFPTYLLPGAVLDILGFSACIWIISSVYGLSYAGQYSQIQRLIGAPMLLVSMSLSQVMLKHTSDEQRANRPLWPLVKNLGALLGVFCLGLLLLLFFAGSWGLHFFLGPKWRVDTYFICIVAVAVFVRTAVSPLSYVLLATRRLRPCLIWQCSYFLSNATVLIWAAHHTGFDRFLLVYAIHECFHYTIYFLIIRYAAKRPRYEDSLGSIPAEVVS